MSHDRVTLSMRELDGFFWKASVASVLRARNSCTSSLLAASGMVHSFCRSRKGCLRENKSRVFHKSHISSTKVLSVKENFLRWGMIPVDFSWLPLCLCLGCWREGLGRVSLDLWHLKCVRTFLIWINVEIMHLTVNMTSLVRTIYSYSYNLNTACINIKCLH